MVMTAGTMNESPQLYSTNAAATSDPIILPTEWFDLHIPMIKPIYINCNVIFLNY